MNDNLQDELRQNLNRRFYDSYPQSYFVNALFLALAAYQEAPLKTLDALTEVQHLRGSEQAFLEAQSG